MVRLMSVKLLFSLHFLYPTIINSALSSQWHHRPHRLQFGGRAIIASPTLSTPLIAVDLVGASRRASFPSSACLSYFRHPCL
ncbi:hypothetical protein BO99DRAFT_28988 [Aspergillus violaceofuscus CBS 115571]|uniref:Secreted protein n=1 Tax=Aspergillus violaceofuscus (strain CBS 115571) TaxID=1450538 RepID=A0A2V5GYC4_ASPV1|nr:hypothetical protein BO99DRAFT_28988 [Aspergillus violaceofuscus CBS 115571]